MKNYFLLKVLGAIVLGAVAGYASGAEHGIGPVTFLQVFDLIGRLFLNALTLVVVPLVAASIITGTARLGGEQSFKTLGLKTLFYFFVTSFLAILTGFFFALYLSPGTGASFQLALDPKDALESLHQAGQSDTFDKITRILLNVIPANIFAAASQGQMLGIIFFCFVFGYFASQIEAHSASVVLGFWKGVFQIMLKFTHWVMKALPLGVFGLVAKVVATTGLEAFTSVALFFITVLLALGTYLFVILPLLLYFLGGVNPWAHFKAMAPALLTAFSTSSSAATLPVTIECIEKNANVSNRICSFIVPLGTSVNLTGTALYIGAAVVFIAQAYGAVMHPAMQFTVILLTLLTSFGMAGIPSAGLITIVLILQALSLPAEGIGLLLAVERILDMCRTPVNVFGTSCCAVLVASSEGEKGILKPVSEAA